jgi:hypothetical protein
LRDASCRMPLPILTKVLIPRFVPASLISFHTSKYNRERTICIPMKRNLYLGFALAILGVAAPYVLAQTEDVISLGDFARSLRKNKETAPPVVIDNDNLSKIMDDVENHRLNGKPLLSLDSANNSFQVSLPDGTCSLSFNANATSLLTVPYVAEEMPQSELAKLEGPASITGDSLQVSLFNGTEWNLKEITVGLTIVRHTESTSVYYGSARLLPATAQDALPAENTEKPSDLTLLFHLKGSGAPLATTIFREKLTTPLAPDQEWHWAIVSAKGVRPSPLALPEPGLELSPPVFP